MAVTTVAPALNIGSPVASAGAQNHADWLELKALISPDRDASLQDLVAELRRAGTLDAVTERDALDRGSEKSQELAESALAELGLRAIACGDGYPFVLGDQTIRLSGADPLASPYVFMLLLKNFGVSVGPRTVKGASNFEELAEIAAREYLGGDARGARSFHFGFPRRTTPSGFKEALDELCRQLGEGGGSRDRPSRRNQKDAKLDIVAWRPFSDGRNGKLIAFGQCAAGDGWDAKVTELAPRAFTKLWLVAAAFAFDPIVFFFVPYCLDDEDWDRISMMGNTVPFDRCRIAGLLGGTQVPPELLKRTVAWSRHVLGRVAR